MKRLIIAIGLGLLLGCAVANAQTVSPAQQYSHVQDLNNEAWELMHPGDNQPANVESLRRARKLLQQSLALSGQMQLRRQADDRLAVNDRRFDALLRLAKVDAMLGDKPAALDDLDALRRLPLYASMTTQLEREPAFESLHGQPRYQSLMHTLKALRNRWNATAFQTSSASLDEAHRIAGLTLVWSEVRYNFAWFEHVPDLDWNQAYLDFLPRAIAARNAHEYYDVLMRFAALLDDSHTDIEPPKSLMAEFFARPPLRSALIQNHVLVTGLQSPAMAAAGVHVGDEILSVDGVEVHRYAKEHVAPYVSSSTPQDRAVRMYNYQLLAGDHRHPVVLALRDASGHQHRVTLSRERDPHRMPLPAAQWRWLDADIAYLAVNEFGDDQGARLLAQHLPELARAKGLIIDVRLNGGGSTSNGLAILRALSDQPIPVSASRSMDYVPVYRAYGGPYVAWKTLGNGAASNDRSVKHRFGGRVIVLTSPQTISAAEDFVVSFQAMKRGLLVGEKTAGSTGMPLAFDLPGGGKARVCTKQDYFPHGGEFVGKGISPDITVTPTVADIRAGRDPVVARAAAVLRQRSH